MPARRVADPEMGELVAAFTAGATATPVLRLVTLSMIRPSHMGAMQASMANHCNNLGNAFMCLSALRPQKIFRVDRHPWGNGLMNLASIAAGLVRMPRGPPNHRRPCRPSSAGFP